MPSPWYVQVADDRTEFLLQGGLRRLLPVTKSHYDGVKTNGSRNSKMIT